MVKVIKNPRIPNVKTYKKVYSKFRGVDFSADPSQIHDSRSPDALNLISDSGGFPVKRLGWRTLHTIEQPVNGLFFFDDTTFIAHGGNKIYTWSDTTPPQVIYENVNNARSTAFLYNGKLYILTGREYLVYGDFSDGETTTRDIHPVAEDAYIPTTTSAAKPAGGGDVLQAVNLLTPKRKNTFIGDGTTNEFQLDAKDLTSIDEVKVDDEIKTPTTDYTTDLAAGKVTFKTAPPAPNPAGVPNVSIIFAKEVETDRITKCTIAAIYSNRVFFSGNPQFKNADFACALNDPAYIPDTTYTEIGNDGAAIMGYLRLGDALAIIKEDNSQDATVFLRTAQLTSSEMVFPVKQGVSGVGAISPYCFAHLVDDPLFLTRNGVYALATQVVTAEKTLQVRSGFVEARLVKEDLKNAVAVEWNGYYVLCCGNHVYIADSRQKSYANNTTQSYEYEWYYWDNFPARVLLESRGNLYFGTTEGNICRLNTDLKTPAGEPMMSAYNDDGIAIRAYWSTPKADDDSFMTYKTMLKRGCGLYLKAYTRSSVKISIVTDRDFGTLIRQVNAGIFDFNDIDFEHFTFNTLPQNIVPFNTKVKRYKTIQIVVANDALNEGFGVYAIERKFVYGNVVK